MNVNFDSLNYAFGYPEGFKDPSYFGIFDRFMKIAGREGFKFTIFVIGRDLQDPRVACRVREWSQQGHEIGNHTWSHQVNFGALSESEIESEILDAHEIILKTTGKEPRGFIAPAWSSSGHVYRVLIENDYVYDTSVFPSVFLYPMVFKLALNYFKNKDRLKKILNRKDFLCPLTKSVEPFFVDRDGRTSHKGKNTILVLPIPTLSRYKVPVWHTMGYVFGWHYARKALTEALQQKKYFYYLMHPADLIGLEDLDDIDGQYSHSMERMNFSIDEKCTVLNEMIDICVASGRKFVTVGELAGRLLRSSD